MPTGRNLTYAQRMMIMRKNKERVLKACPGMPEAPGIYFFTRSEDGFKYAYVGQSKSLLTRVAQHLLEYNPIDNSIRKRGLFAEGKPFGYEINFLEFPIEQLDEKEQYYERLYADKGYQLYNRTAGGQGKGKYSLDNQKAPRGYRDGLKQGYKNARKDVAHLFEKHLVFSQKSPRPNKNQAKAAEKFREFITVKENRDGEG